jgi:hypothetical protein
VGIALDHRPRGDQLARDAEAALDGTRSQEGGLEWFESIPPSEAFHRRDPRAVGLDAEHQARIDRGTVDQHGTGAALADEAALLRPRQGQVLPQHVEERVVRLDLDRAFGAVDRELDPDGLADAAVRARSRALAVLSARSPSTWSIASR